MSNISRSISTQAIEFGQLIEYNKRNIFLKNHTESEVGRLVPDLFSVFKKGFISKSKWSEAWFEYISISNYKQLLESIQSLVCYLSSTHSAFACSKSTIETLEQGVKYVQS